MALEIFKLVGSIFIDTDKANESLAKTDKKATSVAEGFSNAGKVAAGAAAAIGTAIIGTGTALVGMANDAAKSADEIDKASIRMGIGTDSYQELAYAAGQCGVEMSTLEGAAKKLEGTDLNFDDAISQIIELQTAEERSAMAADLFGEKIAYNLSPLIEQSGESFDGLRDRAHELGLVMSEEAVKTGVEYNDLSSDLKKSFEMLKTNLGSALFPVLNSVIKKLIDFMPTLQALGEKLGPIASDFIEKLIPPLADMSAELMPVILDAVGEIIPLLAEITDQIVPVLVDVLKMLMPIAVQIVKDVLPVVLNLIKLLTPILSTLLKLITPILGAVMQLLSPLLELVSAILTPILKLLNVLLEPLLTILNTILVPVLNIIGILLEPLTELLNAILEPLLQLVGDIITPLLTILNSFLAPFMEKVQALYAWAAPVAKKAFEWLRGFLNFVASNFSSGITKAFEKIGSVVKTVWEGMKTSFKNGVNFWINAINTLINGINKIQPPEWLSNATGIKGVNFPTIPMLAEGGVISGAGSVLVGEAGPEILNLPKGASVTPLSGGIDYDRLASAIVKALREVAPELATNVTVTGNKDGIVNVMKEANRHSILMSGRGVLEA